MTIVVNAAIISSLAPWPIPGQEKINIKWLLPIREGVNKKNYGTNPQTSDQSLPPLNPLREKRKKKSDFFLSFFMIISLESVLRHEIGLIKKVIRISYILPEKNRLFLV